MGVYVRPDSTFYWLWLETAPKGQQRKKTKILIGTSPADQKASRALADQLYHLEMAALAKTHHGIGPPPAKPVIAFDDYCAWYETHVSVHKRGRVRESEILDSLAAYFGDLEIRALTKADVQVWITEKRQSLKASSVNRELDLLKHVLASAVPQYLDASPLVGMRRLRAEPTHTAILSAKDEAKILAELTGENRAIVLLALDTLMRLSDIERFARADDHGAYLVVGDSKTGRYEVPVSKRLRQALDSLPKRGTHYFTRQRGSIAQMFERACRRAKVKYGRKAGGVTFHALRHTGASRMVERGADLRTVMEIGGWKSLRQLSRYTHPTDRAKRAAVELVSGT